jgi:F0F1-type ATP synthase epsilon subunit
MKFKVTITSPKEKLELETSFLTLCAQDGQLTIRAGHAPIFGRLREGQITADFYQKEISAGFFEFIDNQARLTINEA